MELMITPNKTNTPRCNAEHLTTHRDKTTMTPEQIKKELKKQGYSLSLLAEAANTRRGRYSAVIHRHEKSRPIATQIAKALGKPLTEVFPDYQNLEQARAVRQAKIEELQQRLAS